MRIVALTVLSLSVVTLAGQSPLAAQRRSNVLTSEEIERANVGSAYDAVQALRPRWLEGPKELSRMPAHANDAARPAGVAVYINAASRGDLDHPKGDPAARGPQRRGVGPLEAPNHLGPPGGQPARVVTPKPGG